MQRFKCHTLEATSTMFRLAGSFNRWEAPIRLRRAGNGSNEYVRSMVLPLGPVTVCSIIPLHLQQQLPMHLPSLIGACLSSQADTLS